MMASRNVRLTGFILCLTVVLFFSHEVRAEGDKANASTLLTLEGEKADSSFTWDQITAGTARIVVWNNSAVDQDVAARGGQLILLPATQPASKNLSFDFEVSPATDTVHAGQALGFTITLKTSPAKPVENGTYGGILEIRSTKPGKDAIYRTFRVSVTSPRPAIAKINFVALRAIPFFTPWRTRGEVPIAGNWTLSALPKIVGFVHRDPQGWAEVRWTQNSDVAKQGSVPRAVLELDGFPSAGKYEGDITLLGYQDKTAQATVTVIAKDWWLWPVLTICFGILVAWQAKRYLGVLRITWGLRKQEADLGVAFQKSQKEFIERSKGQSFASYSVAKDISHQRVNIRKDLDALEGLWTTSITDNSTYKKVVPKLETVQTQIAQWPELATAAFSLEAAIKTANGHIQLTATVPSSQYSGSPVIFKQVQKLLMGEPILGSEIAPRTKELLDSASLVQKWDESNQNAIAVSKQFAGIIAAGHLTPDQQKAADAIRNSLIAVWTHLWEGTTADDFATGVGSDLDSALQGIRRMTTQRTTAHGFGVPLSTLVAENPASDHFDRFNILPDADYSAHLPADDRQRAALLQRDINFGDRASLLLAFVIALITGLNSNYWDKPFGNLQDYAVLFLWAAGTKVGVDIITAVTDKFVSNS